MVLRSNHQLSPFGHPKADPQFVGLLLQEGSQLTDQRWQRTESLPWNSKYPELHWRNFRDGRHKRDG